MSPELRERAEALFLELIEIEPSRWASLLDARCAGEPVLRAEVASLLGCHAEAGSFLNHQELLALTPDLVRRAEAELSAGTRVGEYTIERMIGAGGMGVVYVATQERPRRTVALKLVNASIASPALVRRFEHEAEVLGRLQHPGIAQIFEAGAAAPSEPPGSAVRPYIAMELVQGPPLIEYAERAKLDARGRLALMVRVCDAVQHAHQRGVIHRDLKPANILVDDHGQPKVLDFGVARATGADLALTTMQTSMGQLIGTLPYMSPEQVLGDPSEVDTRSDVYSLGVVLFELLTGRHPLELGSRSLPDAVAAIRTQDPTRLSSISRVYRGEIDVIVRKALEKDKARRYQSALELGSDIRRYLSGEAITARDDSAFYVLRKQLRRYRGALALAAVALLALVAFALYASVQSHRNQRLAAEERAARVEADLSRDLARSRASELRENLYVSAIGFAQAALAARDVERVKRVLDSCPPEMRGWEWRYLRRIADTSSASVPPPRDGIAACMVRPDASFITAWYGAERVRVLSGEDGREIAGFDFDLGFTERSILSADCGTLIVGSLDGRYATADVRSGKTREVRFAKAGRLVPQAAWPDGQSLLALVSRDGSPLRGERVRLSDGAALASYPLQSPMSGAVSPDGTLVAIGSMDGRVVLFPASGEGPTRALPAHSSFARAVAFSPEGSRIATGAADGYVHISNVRDEQTVIQRLFENKVFTLAWSPDSKWIAAAGTEAVIVVIDAATGQPEASRFGHAATIEGLGWSRDGSRLLTWGRDGTLRWWDEPTRRTQPEVILGSGAWAAVWTPDSSAVYIGLEDGRLLELDGADLRIRRTLAEMRSPVVEMTLSPDAAALAACTIGGLVHVLDTRTWEPRCIIGVPRGRAIDAAFSPDGSMIAVGGDSEEVTLWDARSGAPKGSLELQDKLANRLVWIRGGKEIVAGYDEQVVVHDVASGKAIRRLQGPKSWLAQFRVTPDGKEIVASCDDGSIYVWDVEREGPPRILTGHQRGVFSASISPDGTRLATGGWDNTFRLWDLKSGVELLTARPHRSANWVSEFSPDGTKIITGSQDGSARLWYAPPNDAR